MSLKMHFGWFDPLYRESNQQCRERFLQRIAGRCVSQRWKFWIYIVW